MRLGMLILLLFVMGASSAMAHLFKPDDWAVGTTFPEAPTVKTSRTERPEGDSILTQAVVERKTEAFAASRIQNPVPIDPERHEEAYLGALNGALMKTRGAVVSSKNVKIANRDGRHYGFTLNRGTMIAELSMVIVGDELFMFMHLRAMNAAKSDDAKTFFSGITD